MGCTILCTEGSLINFDCYLDPLKGARIVPMSGDALEKLNQANEDGAAFFEGNLE